MAAVQEPPVAAREKGDRITLVFSVPNVKQGSLHIDHSPGDGADPGSLVVSFSSVSPVRKYEKTLRLHLPVVPGKLSSDVQSKCVTVGLAKVDPDATWGTAWLKPAKGKAKAKAAGRAAGQQLQECPSQQEDAKETTAKGTGEGEAKVRTRAGEGDHSPQELSDNHVLSDGPEAPMFSGESNKEEADAHPSATPAADAAPALLAAPAEDAKTTKTAAKAPPSAKATQVGPTAQAGPATPTTQVAQLAKVAEDAKAKSVDAENGQPKAGAEAKAAKSKGRDPNDSNAGQAHTPRVVEPKVAAKAAERAAKPKGSPKAETSEVAGQGEAPDAKSATTPRAKSNRAKSNKKASAKAGQQPAAAERESVGLMPPKDAEVLRLITQASDAFPLDRKKAAVLFKLAVRRGYLPAYALMAQMASDAGDSPLTAEALCALLGHKDAPEQCSKELLSTCAYQLAAVLRDPANKSELQARAPELEVLAKSWPILQVLPVLAAVRTGGGGDLSAALEALAGKKAQADELLSRLKSSPPAEESGSDVEPLVQEIKRLSSPGISPLIEEILDTSTKQQEASTTRPLMDEIKRLMSSTEHAAEGLDKETLCRLAESSEDSTKPLVDELKRLMDPSEASAVSDFCKSQAGNSLPDQVAPEDTKPLVDEIKRLMSGEGANPPLDAATREELAKLGEPSTKPLMDQLKRALSGEGTSSSSAASSSCFDNVKQLLSATNSGNAALAPLASTCLDDVKRLISSSEDVAEALSKKTPENLAKLTPKLRERLCERGILTTEESQIACATSSGDASRGNVRWSEDEEGWCLSAEVPQLARLADAFLNISDTQVCLTGVDGAQLLCEALPAGAGASVTERATVRWSQRSRRLTLKLPRCADGGGGAAGGASSAVNQLD